MRWWRRAKGLEWSIYYPNMATRLMFYLGYRHSDFARWREVDLHREVMLQRLRVRDRVIRRLFPIPYGYGREEFQLPDPDTQSFSLKRATDSGDIEQFDMRTRTWGRAS